MGKQTLCGGNVLVGSAIYMFVYYVTDLTDIHITLYITNHAIYTYKYIFLLLNQMQNKMLHPIGGFRC